MELAKMKRKYIKLVKDYNKLVVEYNSLLNTLKNLKTDELQLLPIKEVKK